MQLTPGSGEVKRCSFQILTFHDLSRCRPLSLVGVALSIDSSRSLVSFPSFLPSSLLPTFTLPPLPFTLDLALALAQPRDQSFNWSLNSSPFFVLSPSPASPNHTITIMRTSISVVSLSALLLSASTSVEALPSSRRLSVEVDVSSSSPISPISPTSPTSESAPAPSGQVIPLHHRRGSEELTNDDGTLDFGKAHVRSVYCPVSARDCRRSQENRRHRR